MNALLCYIVNTLPVLLFPPAFCIFSIVFDFNNKNVDQFKEECLISLNAYDTDRKKKKKKKKKPCDIDINLAQWSIS